MNGLLGGADFWGSVIPSKKPSSKILQSYLGFGGVSLEPLKAEPPQEVFLGVKMTSSQGVALDEVAMASTGQATAILCHASQRGCHLSGNLAMLSFLEGIVCNLGILGDNLPINTHLCKVYIGIY